MDGRTQQVVDALTGEGLRKCTHSAGEAYCGCAPSKCVERRCKACGGTGERFHATGYDWRRGDTLGDYEDCPQCGGSGEI